MTASPAGSRQAGSERALALARQVLSGRQAWLVGGHVRDSLSGRPTPVAEGLTRMPSDIDLVVAEDAQALARMLAAAGKAACFELSRQFGSWRVIDSDAGWQIDVEPLRGGAIEQDLMLRDLTLNAIAQSLDGLETLDPAGGIGDLEHGRLRAVTDLAFADDPLRVLRLARQASDFGFQIEPATLAAARQAAPRLQTVAAERIFTELKLMICGPDPLRGLQLTEQVDALQAVLPELSALHGVGQSHFHHLDVFEHTMEVLRQAREICAQLTGAAPLSDQGTALLGRLHDGDSERLTALLLRGAADGINRVGLMRWGALLHDIAKPQTRTRLANGRIGFPGHDLLGERVAQQMMSRLRSSARLRGELGSLVRGHLRLGFLVHEPQPLDRRTLYGYLRASDRLAVELTLLSVVDRLATRGARSEQAIAAHLQLAAETLPAALEWSLQGGAPQPLLRGDELAAELVIAPGEQLGALLEGLREAQYVGAVADRAGALAHARAQLAAARADT